MKLNTNAIAVVVLIALIAYLWLGKQPLEGRGVNVFTCTSTEPRSINEFLAINNTPQPAGTDITALGNITALGRNYSYYECRGGLWCWGAVELWNQSVSGRSCEDDLTLNIEAQRNNSITVVESNIKDRRVLTYSGNVVWCNEMDNVKLGGNSLDQFANYTRTYITCTNRTTTAAEDACETTTQPAVWNGTACRCVVTGYALDATSSTANCNAKVKAVNETCGGPAGETCTEDLKCVIKKDETEGLCQSRTWLDATVDYIKDHAWQSIAIGAGVVILVNVLLAKFTLRKMTRRRRR